MKPSTYCTNCHLRMYTTGNGNDFYEETKIYNGVRAADLSDLCHLPKLQPQSRKSMSKLIQGVLLRGWHNRMYHYEYAKKFPGKTYRQSVELPIDWLIYYDSVSRVAYLILPDRTKRESHYYNSTAVFTKEDLIPSERMQITICHSPYTTQPSTNKSMLRRNIYICQIYDIPSF